MKENVYQLVLQQSLINFALVELIKQSMLLEHNKQTYGIPLVFSPSISLSLELYLNWYACGATNVAFTKYPLQVTSPL